MAGEETGRVLFISWRLSTCISFLSSVIPQKSTSSQSMLSVVDSQSLHTLNTNSLIRFDHLFTKTSCRERKRCRLQM